MLHLALIPVLILVLIIILALCKAAFTSAFRGMSFSWAAALIVTLVVIVVFSGCYAGWENGNKYLASLSALLLVGGTILQIISLLTSSPAEDTAKDDASASTPSRSDSCEAQPDPQTAKAIPLVKDLSTRNALEAAGWATIFCAALGAAIKVFFF